MLAAGLLVAGPLACCAMPLAPDPTAEVPHCYKTSKGRVIACTPGPAPSLNADAEAKRFAPDPNALTVYVVRRNWGDVRNFVEVDADSGAAVETLPNTMARFKLKPGTHNYAFEFEGQRHVTAVEGEAGQAALRPDRRLCLGLEEHVHTGDRGRRRDPGKGAQGRRLQGMRKRPTAVSLSPSRCSGHGFRDTAEGQKG